jgi:hypothetical protein
MRTRRSKIKLALMLVVLMMLGAFLWGPVQQARNVAAVQDSLQRLEVNFSESYYAEWLPESLDHKVADVIDFMYADAPGHRGKIVPGGMSGPKVYQERFRSLFRGPIEHIEIWDPECFCGDVGAALARFPQLRILALKEDGGDIPEPQWIQACVGLRRAPKLHELTIGGDWFTDAALAGLAGHPTLSRLIVQCNHLSSGCGATLASMPRLKFLSFRGPAYLFNNEPELVDAEWIKLCAGLRTLPHLEELELDESDVTDASIAQLAGHPTLTTIRILDHQMTPSCKSTFATLPRLKRLELGDIFRGSTTPLPQEEKDAIITALPGVVVVFE